MGFSYSSMISMFTAIKTCNLYQIIVIIKNNKNNNNNNNNNNNYNNRHHHHNFTLTDMALSTGNPMHFFKLYLTFVILSWKK